MKNRFYTLLCFILIVTNIFAEDYVTIDRITYQIVGGSYPLCASVKGISMYSPNKNDTLKINILDSVNIGRHRNLPVKSISCNFDHCEYFFSVTLPNTITYIKPEAFKDSKLTSITLSNSLEEIKEYTFYSCSALTSVVIPESVTKIGDYAFGYCRKLTSVTIPNSVTEIGKGAFYRSNLTEITIPKSVKTIEQNAFASCNLTSIVIPESVTEIKRSAFSNCINLTEITIPKSVKIIEQEAFMYCESLKTITIPESISAIEHSIFAECDSLQRINWNAISCGTITNSSFHILKAKNLINITFGDSVKYVPSYLCYHLEKLTNVTIPNSVKTIGESAFYNCSSLENIILGNSIQHIESGAFYGCSLKTLILPKSISRIDSYSLCETLDTIICHSNTPPQLEYQRESIYEKCVLVVPHFFASDYKKSGNWKNFKNILTFRPPKYKITAIANDSVMGNVKGSGIYYETREIELTAIPNKDYHFTQWTDGNKQSRRTIVVSQDSTFIAEFAINPYNVKIIQSENGTVNDISGKYNYEDEITLIATANEGYKFKKWSDDNTENPRTLVITKDIELSAIFEHIDTSTENILDNQTNIHSNNGVLHILGETIDYQILDISGRLIYRGNQATLPLPRGIYLIIIENKAQKIVL